MTDAYKIGISVALTNLVSAELLKIFGDLGRVHKASEGARMSLLGLGGVAVLGSLTVVGLALKVGVEEARKFQIEATKFAALGFGDAVNNQAQNFARGMKTMGTSATENMQLVADAMAVFKSLPHAEMAAPLMAQMKFGNEAVYGEEGGARESKFMDMLKVIEFRRGLRSDEEFKTQADFVQKVINGSRGRVDATQLLNALKTGGVSLAGLSNEGFYLGSEPLIQEFGGSRYGTANMSIYQNLVQMRTTQQALSELMRLGLLDKSKVEMNSYTGKVKRAKAGAFIGSDVLTKEGDLAFLEKVLLPAFAAHGITSEDDVIMELGRILTNRTGSSLLSRVYQQRQTLHTQMDANKNAMNIGQLVNAADKTLDGKVIELKAEWAKLELQMGVLLPLVTKITGWLVDIVKALQFDSPFAQAAANFVFGGAGHSDPSRSTAAGSVSYWKNALSGGSAVPPPGQKSVIQIDHSTNLDGLVLAKQVTKYQVDQMDRMPSSGGFPDLRMTPMVVGP